MASEKILITKAGGDTEPFDIDKLAHSLQKAKASKEVIEQITHHILQELEEGITTQEIYRHAFSLLHKMEFHTALRYSLRKAMFELGPSGFPFEQMVAEIFKYQGYTVETDQMVKGYCADHEVDVVAWKKDHLVMSEVKYHGQVGLKSDLKIVLYVKARFEDLAKMTFSYGNPAQPLHMSEGMLITNTKFTTSAIKYAECQGMKIIGWNYPLDGNLHDLIEAAKLHPLTCLHSLSVHDKKTLLDKKIVLCKDLVQNPSLLKSIGLSETSIETVLEEIQVLTQ